MSVAKQSNATRKLFSLCFLLALVILLIQKAADPGYISSSFRALGVPLEELAPSDPLAASTTGGSTDLSNMDDSPADPQWLATCDDLIPRLLSDASDQQIRSLGLNWFSESRAIQDQGGAAEDESNQRMVEAFLDATESSLETITHSVPVEDSPWREQLDRFTREWQTCGEVLMGSRVQTDAPNIDPYLAVVLSREMDRRLVEMLEDGAPWSKLETTAFWRMLQRTRNHASESTALISTLQLESESDVFKGRRVRFRGSVRRVDFVQREQPGFGIQHYWIGWLRGDDGSAQPVAVYSLDPKFEQLASLIEPEANSYPDIEVSARVGKRLAYASTSGVQIAPCLFADRTATIREKAVQPVSPSSSLWRELAMALLGGGLLAGLITIPILLNRKTEPIRYSRSPTVSSKSSSDAKQELRKSLLLFVFVPITLCGASHSLGQSPSQASGVSQSAEPVSPPWAAAGDDQAMWQSVLEERLQTALEASASELSQYLALPHDGADVALPDCILKSLRAIEQVGWDRARRLQIENVGLKSLRIERLRFRGVVTTARQVALTTDQRDWFQVKESDQLFKLQVTTSNADQLDRKSTSSSIPVVCSEAPSLWQQDNVSQPVEIDGFGIFHADAIQGAPLEALPLCVLTDIPNWILTEEFDGLQPSLSSHYQTLGRQGWNLAWIDRIARNSQQPLNDNEAEAFYSLIRLVGDGKVDALFGGATSPSLMKLMSAPSESVGQPVHWQLRLVTGSVVPVVDPRAQAWLGADRYIQFDGFVEIGDRSIRYQYAGKDDKEDLDFEREFPITIVTTQDSEFVPARMLSEGVQTWEIGKYANVEGTFYRLWSYHSELLERRGAKSKQVAPLVVARRLSQGTPPVPLSSNEIGWFGYALCLATLVCLAGILYSVFKTDRTRIRLR